MLINKFLFKTLYKVNTTNKIENFAGFIFANDHCSFSIYFTEEIFANRYFLINFAEEFLRKGVNLRKFLLAKISSLKVVQFESWF